MLLMCFFQFHLACSVSFFRLVATFTTHNNSNSNNNNNNNNNLEFGSCTRKTFDRFTTKDSYTWNITHNTESTAM